VVLLVPTPNIAVHQMFGLVGESIARSVKGDRRLIPLVALLIVFATASVIHVGSRLFALLEPAITFLELLPSRMLTNTGRDELRKQSLSNAQKLAANRLPAVLKPMPLTTLSGTIEDSVN